MSKKTKQAKKAAVAANEVETRKISQVSSISLIAPEDPGETIEPTEQEQDFAKAEAEIDAAIKALKAKKASLKTTKKQVLGGVKLAKRRAFAQAAIDWAVKASTKYLVTVERANVAVIKLSEYEAKLGLPLTTTKATVDMLGHMTEAAEAIGTIGS